MFPIRELMVVRVASVAGGVATVAVEVAAEVEVETAPEARAAVVAD